MSHHCKFCGDPIRWEITPAGRRIALEASSDDAKGTFVLRVEEDARGERRRVAVGLPRVERLQALAEGELLFLAHRAVCHHDKQGSAIPSAVRKQADQIIAGARKKVM